MQENGRKPNPNPNPNPKTLARGWNSFVTVCRIGANLTSGRSFWLGETDLSIF